MTCHPQSPYLQQLQDRIALEDIPFSERGSRLLIFRGGSTFNIRLAERWTQWVKEVGDYRQRPPVVKLFRLTDETGGPLDFELSAYPHALCLKTRLGGGWLTFADEETLYLKLPAARLGVNFECYAMNARDDRRGGEFKGDPQHRTTHRNIAYTTNARIESNIITPSAGVRLG